MNVLLLFEEHQCHGFSSDGFFGSDNAQMFHRLCLHVNIVGWNAEHFGDQENSRSEDAFVKTLNQSTEWTDLELLLRGVRELGAEPLLLSMPIKGVYYEYLGIGAQARRVYYRRLVALAGNYRVQGLLAHVFPPDARLPRAVRVLRGALSYMRKRVLCSATRDSAPSLQGMSGRFACLGVARLS